MLLDRARKAILAPCLKDRYGNSVREIERTIVGAHGEANTLIEREGISHLRRKSTAFRTKDKPVAGLENKG